MYPKYFDTHCHLNFPDYYSDAERGACLARAREAGVWIINVGCDFESSRTAIDLAQKTNEGVYAAVGVHPTGAEGVDFNPEQYRDFLKFPKVVAVGECGLELRSNRRKIKSFSEQKTIFERHIDLALESRKPLIVHCRDAHEELLTILNDYKNSGLCGVIHFFSGTQEQAQKYLELGFLISFTGVITFPPPPNGYGRASARQYDDIIKNTPLDKIMIETDAPFVTPSKYRGKQNEPLFVTEVARKIADLRGISETEVAEKTTTTARKLFNV